ncbi:MAG: prolyl oligopeptidase family serine peptidase [Alphaproteobacteria bacterium]
MAAPKVAPYGTWASPVTADLIVSKAIGLGSPSIDGDGIYWAEGRPGEGGRVVVVRRAADGAVEDVTPAPHNVRSRVHEYGGGAYTVAEGEIFFVEFTDQRIYRQRLHTAPEPLTPEKPWRFADLVLDRRRQRLICVREDHGADGEAANTIVSVPLEAGSPVTVLVDGHDFVSSPRLSPDGRRLAWLSWDHPDMPWDSSRLWIASVGDDGLLANREVVAGGVGESVFQPEWSPGGVLHFVSDRTDWWNLYRLTDRGVEALCPTEAEFGLPQWAFGMATYGIGADEKVAAASVHRGEWRIGIVAGGALSPVKAPFTQIHQPKVVGRRLVCTGGSASRPECVALFDFDTGKWEVLKRSVEVDIDTGYLSTPRPVTFPTADGAVAHGFYYAPTNLDFTAPVDERPPLIVRSHGGPTGAASPAFNLAIQFWTSRGFAVLDVDYRGSTGYGRSYREALNGNWGVADVDDCVHGARYLAERGEVDDRRLIIRGGSAGGYTTLASLTFRDVFAAGASFFGIGDLMTLAADTHKFESRYLDRVVGPLPAAEETYRARSPVNFTERLNSPVIFFQGSDDKVVPPNQAEAMVSALERKGLPVAYLCFEGEGHGFRRAENVKRSLEAELYFYGRVLGFQPADELEPVDIANLPRA